LPSKASLFATSEAHNEERHGEHTHTARKRKRKRGKTTNTRMRKTHTCTHTHISGIACANPKKKMFV
jgi:hypothetical protein